MSPPGRGELAALVRELDWSRTPLGRADRWPQSLRTAVDLLLDSLYPMFVFWGPSLVKIYNDGYRPIAGAKHPWALGRPAREVWPEIWDTIGPMVSAVMERGEATWSDDLPLFMQRRGFAEEVYFTFSYSPVRDEAGRVAGLFCACTGTVELRGNVTVSGSESRIRGAHITGDLVLPASSAGLSFSRVDGALAASGSDATLLANALCGSEAITGSGAVVAGNQAPPPLPAVPSTTVLVPDRAVASRGAPAATSNEGACFSHVTEERGSRRKANGRH
jgi:hypothetical protein